MDIHGDAARAAGVPPAVVAFSIGIASRMLGLVVPDA
jgi:hypothetical protein